MFLRREKEQQTDARILALHARHARPARSTIPPHPPAAGATLEMATKALKSEVSALIDANMVREKTRGELAHMIDDLAKARLAENQLSLNTHLQRDLVTVLLNEVLEGARRFGAAPRPSQANVAVASRASIDEAIQIGRAHV